jgi:sterol 3beta-glucosyltransferase
VRDLRFRLLNRATFSLLYGMWWRDSTPNMREMRGMLDLPPSSARPLVERLPGVGVYSPYLVPRPADWPAHQVATGFVTLPPSLRERLGEDAVPPDLEDWLAGGEPPVYFGFGSMPVLDPPALLQQVADVTKRRGLRGLIGAGWTDFGARDQFPGHLVTAPAQRRTS